MAGFSSVADLQSEIAAGKRETAFFLKTTSSGTSGQWQTFWKHAGVPAAGSDAATTPGTAYSGATAGAITFNDVSTDRRFLERISAYATAPVHLLFYDRLVSVSGIDMSTTGDKTVNSTTLPRYTDGIGVIPIVEYTTSGGATMAFSLSSYTNSDGTTTRAGGSLSLSGRGATAVQWMPLQAGDKGVKSVETINVATSGGSGVVSLTLIKPLAAIWLDGSHWFEKDYILQFTALTRVFDGANIGAIGLYSGGAPSIRAVLRTVYG